jgi:O-antigen/teichoic acid export membrane protein
MRRLSLTKMLARDGTTTSAVVKNFIVRTAMIALNFGTGVTVARSLAPLGRGEQTALALWPILISGLATMGIPAAVVYQTRRRPQDAGRFYFVSMILAFVAGSLAAVLGAVTMPRLLQGYDTALIRDAQWFMLFTPQLLLQLVIRAHLEAKGEFTRSIFSQLTPLVATLGALLILRNARMLTPPVASMCYALPQCLVSVWLLLRTWSRMTVGLRSFGTDASALLSYGLRSYGADVINALSAQLDLAVIVMFLNPVALGLYGVALTIARLVYIVQQSIVSVLFPHASGLDPEFAIALVGRAARISTSLSIVFGAMLLAIVPTLLPMVYGPAFDAALPIIPLLTLEAILAGLYWVLSTAFQTTGRPAVVTLIQTGWLVCALVLLVVLVPRMQTTGAAVALLGASAMRLALVAIAYRMVLHRSLPRLWPNSIDVAHIYARARALLQRHEPLHNNS